MIGGAALRERTEPLLRAMLEELERVVSIDSPTFPPAGTNAVAAHFAERYSALGAEVERVPGSQGTGDHMLARFQGKCAGGPRVALFGHCDTVFPEGEASRRPFRIGGNLARGPGVVDMKGGLVTCYYALAALLGAGFKEFGSIDILYDTDEERGNPSSRPLIEEIGKRVTAALILEPARADGSLVSSRKGGIYGTLRVRGVPAHAGVDPHLGRSAVLELANQIVRLAALNREEGTVNFSSLSGGDRPNIVAEHASCSVELRSDTQATLDAMMKSLEKHIGTPALEGTHVSFERSGGRPVMEMCEETEKLIQVAGEVGKEVGVTVTHTATGGGSDGNFLSPLQVPILDGLGPVGGKFHTDEEYLEISSLVPRTALLSGIIERLARAG